MVARRRDLSTIQRTLARRFRSSRAPGAETATEQDVVEPPRDSVYATRGHCCGSTQLSEARHSYPTVTAGAQEYLASLT